MELEHFEEPDYLRCVVTGSYDVREAIDAVAQIIARCRATALTNVLVDYREMDGSPSVVQKIIFTEETLDLHKQHLDYAGAPLRIAFLGAPEVVNTYNPGLEIAKNRGFSVTITSDTEGAIAFLLEPEL